MVAMTSFHAEKCRRLVIEHETSIRALAYAAAYASSWSIVHSCLFF